MGRKRRRTGRPTDAQPAKAPPPLPRLSLPDRLERVSLLLVACILCARPLVSESLDTSMLHAASGSIRGTIGMCGPGFSLAIASGLIGAAVLWLVAGAIRGRVELIRHGGWVWCGLWLLGAVVAVSAASNKRSAINGAADLAAGLCTFLLLLHLLRQPWQRRVVLAAILAGAAAVGIKCIMQWGWELEETLADFRKNLPVGQYSEAHRALLDARMAANEAAGFFYHPNVCAGYLVLCVAAGIGLTLGKWVSPHAQPFGRHFAILGLVGVVAMVAGLWLTGSLGGQLGFGVAAVLMVVAATMGPLLQRHRRVAIGVVSVGVVAGVVGVVGMGVARDGLPGASLRFRWYYWTAGWKTVRDHWLLGIGRQQFGSYYLLHKPPESTEDVKNVHCAYLASLVECGPLGAIGMIGFVAWLLLRASRPDAQAPTDDGPRGPPTANPLAWMVGILGGVLVILTAGAWGPEDNIVLFLVAQYGYLGLVLLMTLAFFLFDENRTDCFGAGELRAVGLCIACGLAGFLVHNTISFSLYEPSPGLTFFALAAVCLSRKAGPGAARPWRLGRPALVAAAAVGVWVLFAAIVWSPQALSDRLMHQVAHQLAEIRGAAKEQRPPRALPSGRELVERLEEAATVDELDPTPAGLLAEQYLRAHAGAATDDDRRRWLKLAEEAARDAQARDPLNSKWDGMLAGIHARRYEITSELTDIRAACRAMGTAATRNPTHARFQMESGDLLVTLWQRTGHEDARLGAIDAYGRAAAAADAIPRTEFPRLMEAEREAIAEQLRRLTDPNKETNRAR